MKNEIGLSVRTKKSILKQLIVRVYVVYGECFSNKCDGFGAMLRGPVKDVGKLVNGTPLYRLRVFLHEIILYHAHGTLQKSCMYNETEHAWTNVDRCQTFSCKTVCVLPRKG